MCHMYMMGLPLPSSDCILYISSYNYRVFWDVLQSFFFCNKRLGIS